MVLLYCITLLLGQRLPIGKHHSSFLDIRYSVCYLSGLAALNCQTESVSRESGGVLISMVAQNSTVYGSDDNWRIIGRQ